MLRMMQQQGLQPRVIARMAVVSAGGAPAQRDHLHGGLLPNVIAYTAMFSAVGWEPGAHHCIAGNPYWGLQPNVITYMAVSRVGVESHFR